MSEATKEVKTMPVNVVSVAQLGTKGFRQKIAKGIKTNGASQNVCDFSGTLVAIKSVNNKKTGDDIIAFNGHFGMLSKNDDTRYTSNRMYLPAMLAEELQTLFLASKSKPLDFLFTVNMVRNDENLTGYIYEFELKSNAKKNDPFNMNLG